MGELDVLEEVIIERRVGELEDWLWDIVAGSFNWDIIVFLEVDTGLLLAWVVSDTEELALNTWVGWSSNVLSLDPSSITATSRSRTTTTAAASRWASVCIAVECGVWCGCVPAWTSSTWCWPVTGTRLEVGSVCPVSSRARPVGRESVSAWKRMLAGSHFVRVVKLFVLGGK